MSAPSTPIRAITSTLSLRSAPSIPPPSKTYEPLLKAILHNRLIYSIFLYSAAFTWAVVALYLLWLQGGTPGLGLVGAVLSPISPWTVLFALAAWLLGVLPVIILRKAYLTASPTAASSPSRSFQLALTKQSTSHFALVYTTSAVLLTILHISLSYTYEPALGSDPKLTVFVKSKKHPYYLNGRTLFLVTSQLFLAGLYLLRNNLMDRSTVKWTSSLSNITSKPTLPTSLLTYALSTLFVTLLLTSLSLSVHLTIFAVSRSLFLPILFKIPLLNRVLRPFVAHFTRGGWTIGLLLKNIGLIGRAGFCGWAMLSLWEFAERVFDTVVAEPVQISHLTPDPFLTLISGLTSPSLYFKHFAYAEFRSLAVDDSQKGIEKREAMFADQKFNPGLWAVYVRESLLVLGREYQRLLRRGKPEESAAKVAAPAKPPPPSTIPLTPLVRTSVLKPAKKQSPLKEALDSLAADGVVTKAAEEGVGKVPDLFRSVSSAVSPNAPSASSSSAVVPASQSQSLMGGELANKLMRYPKGRIDEVWKLVGELSPVWLGEVGRKGVEWWRKERVSRVVEGCFESRKLDVLVIESLCALTAASLTQDKFGVVQRDIPRIIEALCQFLSAIEDYQKELNDMYAKKSPSSDEDAQKMSEREKEEVRKLGEEVARAGEVLGEVGDALKEGMVKIVTTFGDRLAAFKFPPRIARKLQGFVDYH